MWLRSIFIIVFLNTSISYAANILYMSILTSPSHHFWNRALSVELAKRGHNLTIISPYTEAKPAFGTHYIRLGNDDETVNQKFVRGILEATETINPIYEAFIMQDSYAAMCSDALKTDGFNLLLNYPNDFKFDLVIHDFTVGSCLLPFVHKFNYPPLLAVTAFGHPPFLDNLIGGHQYYAYAPHFSTAFDDKMSFTQRLFNFILHVEEMVLFKYYLSPQLNAMITQYFGPDVPPILELEQKTALAFVNTNPVMDYLSPLPENVIAVGGLHIKEPKPLSKDLQQFIDSSRNGVVVVSFGSNYRSDYMPQAKQQILLQVFKQIPDYHFIWKFESNVSTMELPNNVQIHPWLPLSDILANSKVKAIFFHGGLLTTQESIYRSIPMIIMPLALDQRQNLIKTRRLGISEGVEYLNLNIVETKNTILKVLEDPSYALNASKWSARFRDQKEAPMDRAIWWIRNPNCEYLKSPVFRLGFIFGNTYDVIIAITLIALLVVLLLSKIFNCCFSKYTKYMNHKDTTNYKKTK